MKKKTLNFVYKLSYINKYDHILSSQEISNLKSESKSLTFK